MSISRVCSQCNKLLRRIEWFSIFFVFCVFSYASPGSVDGEYCGEVGDLVGASASDSPTLVGLYCGEVGEYCGDVGEYAGDVGE